MKELIFITGGVRSGKSNYGQQLAEKMSENPIYLATSRIWDKDFEKRVIRHQEGRGEHWTTMEEQKKLSQKTNILENRVVLLDCITLWITNIYHDNKYNFETSVIEAKKEWNSFNETNCNCIVISNEIGMGLHGDTNLSRKFVDFQGIMNQHIASMADQVYFMVSGIPMKIK